MRQYRQHGLMLSADELHTLDTVARALRASRSRALRLVIAFYAEHPDGLARVHAPAETMKPVHALPDTPDTSCS